MRLGMKLFAALLWLPLAAHGQVISDSLKAGTDRQAGIALDKQPSVTGAAKWRALKGLTITAEGIRPEAAAGAHVVIPEIAGTIRMEADITATGSGFTGLALGRGDLSGNFWKNLGVMVLVASDRYQIHIGGKDWIVKKDESVVRKDAPNHLDFQLDTLHRTATLSINGQQVVNGQPLPADARVDGLTAAGFRFHEPVVAGKPLLANFKVTLESRAAAGLSLIDPAMSFVTPGVKSTLIWQAASKGPDAKLPFTLRDYEGKVIGEGTATVDDAGMVTLDREFSEGYAEITFADANQTFGVVGIPAHTGAADPFFALDAGLSWLEQDPAKREGLVKIAKRSGVSIVRERMGVGNVLKTNGGFDFETPRQFGTLRKVYAAQQLPILEILSPSDKPGNLAAFTASLAGISRHWTIWGGAEASNEPDLHPIPASDYVPLVKTMSRALKDAGSSVPVVAGAFATIPPGPYFDTCVANGMLEECDAVSFHSYDRAPAVAGIIARYRTWLGNAGKGPMPLWHTECGWPWINGPARPPHAQDADSAMEIAAKAIESKACGVTRHFPFVFTYYEEGLKNFSMMGREVTPLRSMAAYANAIRLLSGKRYLGDLPGADPAVKLARVFGTDGGERIAVLYTGKIDAQAEISVRIPASKAIGADGRSLTINEGKVRIPDGLLYLVIGNDVPLETNNRAMELSRLGSERFSHERRASPVVLQFNPEGLQAKVSSRRYLLTPETAARFPLRVRINNLSDAPIAFTPELKLPDGKTEKKEPLSIPAMGQADLNLELDLSSSLDIAETRLLSVSGSIGAGAAPLPVAIPLVMEGELDQHLQRHPRQSPLPITEMTRWAANMAGHGKGTLTAADGIWKHDMSFKPPTGSWTYPKFTLPNAINPDEFSGFLIRGRIADRGANVAVIAGTPGSPSFWVPDLFPADGAWHVVYVPFAEFKPGPGGPGNQNTRLDPAAWTTLSIGMSSRTEDNSMEISHWLLVGGSGN